MPGMEVEHSNVQVFQANFQAHQTNAVVISSQSRTHDAIPYSEGLEQPKVHWEKKSCAAVVAYGSLAQGISLRARLLTLSGRTLFSDQASWAFWQAEGTRVISHKTYTVACKGGMSSPLVHLTQKRGWGWSVFWKEVQIQLGLSEGQ